MPNADNANMNGDEGPEGTAVCRACGADATVERRHYRVEGKRTIVVGWQDLTHCEECGAVSVVRDHSVGYERPSTSGVAPAVPPHLLHA